MSRRLIAVAALIAACVTAVPALAENPFVEQLRPRRKFGHEPREAGHAQVVGSSSRFCARCDAVRGRPLHVVPSRRVVVRRHRAGVRVRSRIRSSSSTVMSSVRVFASELDARGDFRRVAAASGGGCLGELLASQGMRVLSTTFSRNVAVGDSAVRYRVVARLKTKEAPLPVLRRHARHAQGPCRRDPRDRRPAALATRAVQASLRDGRPGTAAAHRVDGPRTAHLPDRLRVQRRVDRVADEVDADEDHDERDAGKNHVHQPNCKARVGVQRGRS